VRRILQFNIEDRYGCYLDKISPEEIAEFAKECGFDTLVVFARDGWGRAFYRSEIYPLKNGVSGDFLERLRKKTNELGIKLVSMVCHTSNKFLAEKNPHWVQRSKDERIIYLDTNPFDGINWPLMCLNSEFKEVCVREIKEVHKYSDGFMLDSYRYLPDVDKSCFCENCKRAFREEFNEDLKYTSDWNSEYFWKVWFWRNNVVINSLRNLKEVAGKKPLIYNAHPAGWGWRANYIVEEGREYIDIIFSEATEVDFQPLGFLFEISKLVKGLSQREVWTSRNVFYLYHTTLPTSKAALELGIWEIVSAGARPLVTTFLSTYYQNKQKLKEVFSKVLRKVEAVQYYLDEAEPVSEVLIVYSNKTRDCIGKENPALYDDEVRGFFHFFYWNNYQVGFIGDRALASGKLDDFRILVLPNKAVMSKEESKVIKKLSSSKTVLATYLTSLYKDFRRRRDFLLQDEFGASFDEVIESPWFYIKNVVFGDYDPSGQKICRVSPLNRKFIKFEIYSGKYKFGYEYVLGVSPPPRGEKVISFVTSNKITYIPFQLGRMLFYYSHHSYEKFVKELLNHYNKLIKVSKKTVRATIWKNDDKLYICLLNYNCNERMSIVPPLKTTFSTYDRPTIRQLQRISTVHNIVLKVLGNFSKVSSLFSSTKPKIIKKDKGYTIIKVPELKVFDLLILE